MPIYKKKGAKSYTVRVNYVAQDGTPKSIYGSAKTYNEAIQVYQSLYNSRFEQANISLSELCEYYLIDCKSKCKLSTYVINCKIVKKILSMLNGDVRIDKITPMYIRSWQTSLVKSGLSETYVNMVNARLNSILNYGVMYYNLKDNPVKCAGKIGKTTADERDFWSPDDFKQFISGVDKEKELPYWVLFHLLFYTGCRIGEALGLYPSDIDLENETICINRTYLKIKKVGYLSSPKTKASVRQIKIPKFLCEILNDYMTHLPSLKVRLFFSVYETHINTLKKRVCKETHVRYIRNHDFRHSAISFLVSQNIPIVEIANRVGHANPSITYNVYSHLYVDSDKKIAELEDKDFKSWEM